MKENVICCGLTVAFSAEPYMKIIFCGLCSFTQDVTFEKSCYLHFRLTFAEIYSK